MTGSLLEVRALGVDYHTRLGPLHTLDGVDVEVAPGEIVGVVGESGCGKSTLAAAVMGLLAPNAIVHSGVVRFEGRDIASLQPDELRAIRGRHVARIPQDAAMSLNPTLSVGRQFKDALRAHRRDLDRAQIRRTAELAMSEVGLADPARLLRRYPHQLSGGMRQRVTVAMALALQPALLVADEPTSALDATIEAQVIDLLARLRDEHGMALLFVSHNLGAVAKLCDRVVVMYAGQIVEHGPTASVVHRPAHPYTRALLAAIPDPSVVGRLLDTIPGQPPTLLAERPTGCRFADRCPIVRDTCRTTEPTFVEVDGSSGRCHALDPTSSFAETRGSA